MDKAKRDMVLGLVFFGGLTLLLVATATLGSFSWQERSRETLYFPSAGGLREGDAVLVLGTRYGQVTDVTLDPSRKQDRIRVDVEFDGVVAFNSDAKFEIRDANMLGGKQVEIDPGLSKDPWDEGKFKVGVTRGNAFAEIGDAIVGDGELKGAVSGINTFFKTLNEKEGSIQKLLTSDELYEKVVKLFDGLQETVDALTKGEGILKKLLHNQEMGQNLEKIVKDFSETMAKVNSGTGTLGRIIHDREMDENFTAIVADLRQLSKDTREGKGALGMLISDSEFRDRVKNIGNDLSDLIAKAKDPNAGLFGALVADEKMLKDARKILDDVAAITDSVRNGDGVLAKLINDKELSEKLERTFNQVIRAIEDAREAAPVGTFFQVFSGAF